MNRRSSCIHGSHVELIPRHSLEPLTTLLLLVLEQTGMHLPWSSSYTDCGRLLAAYSFVFQLSTSACTVYIHMSEWGCALCMPTNKKEK
ncbi:hypothetical protein BKA67DRAFT_553364 [Truncatella angustata]|uniref:Uncharacterized protein n=1 Tax=Truncatella angustata TaxID=152316 RepID=A0A9P8UQ08_9PEZI|nr:uncharacterized protein BKA67DRAFT_553364 [Truncatella angustata]KAH6656845.1 hypothetical protein BKA67DRAFT_553364 [Truncatella angustata]